MTFVAFAPLRCCRTFGLSPIVSRPGAPETLVRWGEKWATIQPKLGTKPDFAQVADRASVFGFASTSNVLATSSRQAGDLANFESDPIKILPQLLDQLIALGQTAQQLRQALDNNGHHPDKVADPIRQTLQGGGHGS